MNFSVTSVQCMSTVWSADHFAHVFTVHLTSTDWHCSASLTAGDLNPASEEIIHINIHISKLY